MKIVTARALLGAIQVGTVLLSGSVHAITFKDMGLPAGFQDRLTHGRALVVADFNGDSHDDFFLGNPSDPQLLNDPSFLLISNGPDENGAITFSMGQVLLQGDIAFTASAADYDNDGDPDLFIGIGGQEGIGFDYLFRNDDGVLIDVSEAAGIRGPLQSQGNPVPVATSSGTWADYDRDGDLDLFVAARHRDSSLLLPDNLGWRDSLFRNNGDGTFTDVTQASGIRGTESSMTASWGDFDNDGWEDIFVPHIQEIPSLSKGYKLYRNNQDGTFTDMHLEDQALNVGAAAFWASVASDFNNDGKLDVLAVARFQSQFPNDVHALLINQGDMQFTNETVSSRLTPTGEQVPFVMGCQVGDLNNDGYTDVIFANGGPFSGNLDEIHLSSPSDSASGIEFHNVSASIDMAAAFDDDCVSPAFTGFGGTSFVDHENMLAGESGDGKSLPTGSNEAMATINLCNSPYPYRGHAVVLMDLDKDGDLDMAMTKGGTEYIAPQLPSNEPNRLFINQGGNDKNWLFVKLEGTVSNRDATGALIRVRSRQGANPSRMNYESARSASCFSASGPKEIHFGLGDDDTVEQVRIFWPSGVQTTLTDVAINQRVVVTEQVSFLSDFNAGSAPSWTAVSGAWSVEDNSYKQAGAGPAITLEDDNSRTDFTLIGKLTYLIGAQRMALLARASSDGQNFYAVWLT